MEMHPELIKLKHTLNMEHKDYSTIERGFEVVKASPSFEGTVQMVVIRPEVNQRKELDEGQLDVEKGLVGDNWATRGSSQTEDGNAHPGMQINIMNSRVIRLVTHDRSEWKMAGDQLFVDLNLSKSNMPPGTRFTVGDATLEVTDIPHTGCKKFAQRFGTDALKFISTKEGKEWQLRGINAKVIKSGAVKLGDTISKIT
ncbi:MAG: MOSC domain-containing protein [Cyclobacteriaceae bacterium]|nr:MAG: MOSC domain-containing protein [Cyclobacteriaceae bacterium]